MKLVKQYTKLCICSLTIIPEGDELDKFVSVLISEFTFFSSFISY